MYSGDAQSTSLHLHPEQGSADTLGGGRHLVARRHLTTLTATRFIYVTDSPMSAGYLVQSWAHYQVSGEPLYLRCPAARAGLPQLSH